MSFTKSIAAGVIALAGLVAAVPADAQSFRFEFSQGAPRYEYHSDHRWRDRDYRPQRTLSPQEVRRILRDKGYRQINYVDRRGNIYQVRATTERGRRVGLVINARNGAILNRYRL